MQRNLILIFLTIVLASMSVLAQQKQQPPARQQPSTAESMRTAPRPVTTFPTGSIEGYVYWDTHAVQHKPALACNGLTVTVSAGTPPSGKTPTFEQYQTVATSSSFSYLNNGSTLGICAYALHHMPVGQDLQIKISVAPSAFSAAVTPALPPTANDVNAPYKIIGGKCANVPPAVPSASVLGSHWWTCGGFAYNVNFVLQAPMPAPR